jgi:hypothetical protein
MGRSPADRRRQDWKRRNQKPSANGNKRERWLEAKRENEEEHVHFMCNCRSCDQEFMICGLPCFVICPNCHLVLRMQFA